MIPPRTTADLHWRKILILTLIFSTLHCFKAQRRKRVFCGHSVELLQENMMMCNDTSQGRRSEGEEGRRVGHPWTSTAGAAGRRGVLWDFSGPCGLQRRPLVVFLQAFFQGVTQELQLLGGLAHPQLSLAGRKRFFCCCVCSSQRFTFFVLSIA